MFYPGQKKFQNVISLKQDKVCQEETCQTAVEVKRKRAETLVGERKGKRGREGEKREDGEKGGGRDGWRVEALCPRPLRLKGGNKGGLRRGKGWEEVEKGGREGGCPRPLHPNRRLVRHYLLPLHNHTHLQR